MVLSNKKLKQRLREAKSESVTAEAASISGGVNELLEATKKKKPKLSKREKRRKVQSLSGLEGETEGPRSENGEERAKKVEGTDDREEKGGGSVRDEVKKEKKRKRGEGEEKEANEAKEAKKAKLKKKLKMLKKKKESKKKKKEKKKTEKEKDKEKLVTGEGEEEVKGAIGVSQNDVDVDVDLGTRVYVGGIPYYSSEDDIRSYFEGCGTITEIDCMKFADSGKFRGIAIISFKTDAAAKRALALDGSDMGGLYLKIQPYRTTRSNKVPDFAPGIVEGYNRIYAGNLSWDITEDDLKKFFSGCNISAIRFGKDKESGEFRGYAHVDFSDSSSVALALKLDQHVVCGRPIKISCAVPKKGAKITPVPVTLPLASNESNEVTTSTTNITSGKIRRRTCYECGEKGHLSTDCPKITPVPVALLPVTPVPVALPPASNESNDVAAATSGKIRRRTCYECGEKGHLSTDCPKITPVPVALPPVTPVPVALPPASNEYNNVAATTSGKIRRRTCYECGEKGHLSTDCPKITPVPVALPPVIPVSVALPPASNESNDVAAATSGKIRRRTCYECGEKGHLSTDCPKITPVPVALPPVTPVLVALPPASSESNDVAAVATTSGKIRRRTCYECGEKGHLSTDCPKKQTADPS